MLIEFSVENFLSFKERVTFSMLASKDMEHDETNVITLENGKRYLKTAVIYGANASGKSNLLKAMNFMTDFVRNSHQMQIGALTGVVPFKLDPECLLKPSKFDIIFISQGIKYAYGFAASNKEVFEEYLYYYPNGRQSTIFERFNINEYRFTEDKDEQNSIKERNTVNKLYLSTAANWNYTKVSQAFFWLQHFKLCDDKDGYLGTVFKTLFPDNSLKLVADWLKIVDMGIVDLIIDKELYNLKEISRNIILDHIYTYHKLASDNKEKVKFTLSEESEGTIKFFLLSIQLATYLTFAGNGLMIDEIDTHLHTLLSKHIIGIYNSTDNNRYDSQLIFTTHDTNLLDLDLFRRDQIWFTEKKPDTGATDLYSLYDFGVRKDVNIEKGYLLDRYGAIPFIGGNINF